MRDDEPWVIQLNKSSVIAARVSFANAIITVQFWPYSLRNRPENELYGLARNMIRFWFERETDKKHSVEKFTAFNYIFRQDFHPPDYLFLQAVDRDWDGVARFKMPMFWASLPPLGAQFDQLLDCQLILAGVLDTAQQMSIDQADIARACAEAKEFIQEYLMS